VIVNLRMLRLTNELENIIHLDNIYSVQLGIFSDEEIKNGSVCEILSQVPYDGSEPVPNGLFDQRMGVIEEGRICETCLNRSELCPGHFAHIELPLPVFHVQFLEYIPKLLRCVCYRCSNILVDKSDPKVLSLLKSKKGKHRFTAVNALSMKIKKCQFNNGCNAIQPTRYFKQAIEKMQDKKTNFLRFFAEFKSTIENQGGKELFGSQKKQQQITSEMCYEIFKRITDEDVEFLGFDKRYSRPERFICKVLPVPPPAVRPSIRQENNSRAEDDLTYALSHIIKTSRTLRQKIDSGVPREVIESYLGLLQYHVAIFIDNTMPGVPQEGHRSGRHLKTIIERLKGKDGRMRNNIQGKRVDYSARSVISADPNMDIDEFGIPFEVAMTVTFPDIVTKYNKDFLMKLVRNGPTKYPGAKSIKKMTYDCFGTPSPCTISLKHVDVNSIQLQEGDIVNRHLQDGDVCLFNRQPSLHRMSMMGHKVRVLNSLTFRLNVTDCKPYAADFDGDKLCYSSCLQQVDAI